MEILAHRGGTTTTGTASTDFADHVAHAWSEGMATSPTSTTALTEMGGMTFTAGTHKFNSAINIAFGTTVTLDGPGEFLFIAGTTMTTAADTSFILLNGAKAANI